MNIFPSYYFPPVPWWSAALASSAVLIDVHQPYRKQTYATRAQIKMADRTLPLTVHAERRSARCALKEKKISYAENWPRHHWRSLETAYRSAPFFEHYAPELESFFSQRSKWLVDLHFRSLELISGWIKITLPIGYATTEISKLKDAQMDFRTDFDPSLRRLPDWFRVEVYPQLFDGFVPGLSILDLLLNAGPESRLVLKAGYASA